MTNEEALEGLIVEMLEKQSSHIRRTSLTSFIRRQDEALTMLLENDAPLNHEYLRGVATAFDLLSDRFGIPEFGDSTDWRRWCREMTLRSYRGVSE